MKALNLGQVDSYIRKNIGPGFHDKKIKKLKQLTLQTILKRKNPYLYKAKNIKIASDYVKAVMDAAISSGEETMFGNFLEKLAIYVCGLVWDGRKSATAGMDLEFRNKNKRYLISIKSGPNWGNAGQIQNLVSNFNKAKRTIATSGGAKGLNIICVEACSYGTDDVVNKGTHLKLCGQRFWELISGGNANLYRELIEPLAYKAKEKDEELKTLYATKLNLFNLEFSKSFCKKGLIDWNRLVKYNSGKKSS